MGGWGRPAGIYRRSCSTAPRRSGAHRTGARSWLSGTRKRWHRSTAPGLPGWPWRERSSSTCAHLHRVVTVPRSSLLDCGLVRFARWTSPLGDGHASYRTRRSEPVTLVVRSYWSYGRTGRPSGRPHPRIARSEVVSGPPGRSQPGPDESTSLPSDLSQCDRARTLRDNTRQVQGSSGSFAPYGNTSNRPATGSTSSVPGGSGVTVHVTESRSVPRWTCPGTPTS